MFSQGEWVPTADPPPPEGPIVTSSGVETRKGLTFWKESTNLFTGRVISYPGYSPTCYIRGKELYPLEPSEDLALFPEGDIYQQAVREHVQDYGPWHNEFSFFSTHGKESDIPMLLYALESMGESTNGTVVCTQAHCVHALQSITGAKPGYNYSDWEKWWKEEYKTDPPKWKPKKK